MDAYGTFQTHQNATERAWFLYYVNFHWLKKKKKDDTESGFSARVSPGTCGKLRKEWDTNLWNIFSLPLTVELFHLFECRLMMMVRKHIPIIVESTYQDSYRRLFLKEKKKLKERLWCF